MSSTLEQERDLILEQIQASREIYRQILATPPSTDRRSNVMPADFPRSRTFLWIRDHPWITTSAFVALIWLGANRLLQNRHARHPSKRNFSAYRPIKTLLAIGEILLQNPSRLKIVGRLAGSLWERVRK